jgi:5-formyltetrahydrofolate cyclo-ligase
MDSLKHTLRNQLKAQRLQMGRAQARVLSSRIIQQVLECIDWSEVQSIHIYQPIHGQREVDTTTLFEAIWRQYPEIKTATWKKVGDDFVAWWLDSAGPKSSVAAGYRFSVIIVPVLGFNDSLHRIGYGGGFYDRFLLAQPEAITIGLCYEFGRVDSFRREAHDIPLRHIITESRSYSNYSCKTAS